MLLYKNDNENGHDRTSYLFLLRLKIYFLEFSLNHFEHKCTCTSGHIQEHSYS